MLKMLPDYEMKDLKIIPLRKCMIEKIQKENEMN